MSDSFDCSSREPIRPCPNSINCVCPGLIDTDMAYTLSPEAHANIVANTPMRRLGRPEEIANVVRFLLSDESSFMTGQTVVASGGRVMLPG